MPESHMCSKTPPLPYKSRKTFASNRASDTLSAALQGTLLGLRGRSPEPALKSHSPGLQGRTLRQGKDVHQKNLVIATTA
mmetsp:Transcript_160088/g.292264  ORF Transcript_160088/g.292264 Transcript_160088/m.292264 type:complete len:80 (-) Transcript_160088:2061-2300(-)